MDGKDANAPCVDAEDVDTEEDEESKMKKIIAMRIELLFFWLVCSAVAASGQTNAASNEEIHKQFANDIHGQKGLTCASCHRPELSGKKNGGREEDAALPKIERKQVPQLCGSCHSDPAYMRKYNPSLRTDQLAQYKTSVHGQLFAKGDTKVAVCTDCHSKHEIHPASDSRSTIYPVNVAETCAQCHANAEHMSPYKIKTDQFEQYKGSVHFKAMAERGDLSAPTCSTCHGNHGATPPGVATVRFVCSNCHVMQEQLFEGSPHKEAFETLELPGCITCHNNHGIHSPSDEMLGAGPKSVCTDCHTEGDAGLTTAVKFKEQIHGLEEAIQRSDEILDRGEQAGIEVGEAKLEQAQAKDSLIKARVSIHTFAPAAVQKDVDDGLRVTEKTSQAGKAALKESRFRREGLVVSLIAIFFVLIGLRMLIKQVESKPNRQV